MPDFVESAIKQSKNFSAGLRAAFQVADGELLSHLGSASSDGKLLTGAGATATVLLVDLKHVVAANVGDSTAILMRYGQQITLTSAHRVYGPCAPTPLMQLLILISSHRFDALVPDIFGLAAPACCQPHA